MHSKLHIHQISPKPLQRWKYVNSGHCLFYIPSKMWCNDKFNYFLSRCITTSQLNLRSRLLLTVQWSKYELMIYVLHYFRVCTSPLTLQLLVFAPPSCGHLECCWSVAKNINSSAALKYTFKILVFYLSNLILCPSIVETSLRHR